MPRFMVEIHRRAYERLQADAQAARRTPQDQAGVLLEELLDAMTDVAALAPEQTTDDPVAATAADPQGDVHKPR